MTVTGLAGVYASIGVAAFVWAVLARRGLGEAFLLLALWPLYAPLLAQAGDARERSLLAALRRAEGTPLASLLPDGRQLIRRLRAARARIAELDRLLAELDLPAARARQAELVARQATPTSLAAASRRVEAIERLAGLRARTAAELDEVGELGAQLAAQAALAGAVASDTAGVEVVRELVARVESLGEILEEIEAVPR